MKRRAFIKKSATGLALLPFLSSLRSASLRAAENSSIPKRLILITHPNGVHPDFWYPTAGANTSQFTLNQSHQSLAAYKEHLTLFSGLDMLSGQVGGRLGPHMRGMGAIYTGAPLLDGDFQSMDGSRAGWASSHSLDHRIAQHIGQTTLLPSINLGVLSDSYRSDVQSRFSFSAANQPNPNINDPAQAFNLLFEQHMTGDTVDPDLQKKSLVRASVLDAVTKQATLISQKASKEDRVRLEQHMDFVRTLERKVRNLGEEQKQCEVPQIETIMDASSQILVPAISEAHIDLITAAFSCDLTRVATLQFANAHNKMTFPFLDTTPETPDNISPSSQTGHSLSHFGASNSMRRELFLRDKWHAEQVARLIANLQAIPEGDGTMLDNTLIVWGSEISIGNSHSLNNIPFICAGGRAMGLQTGRYLEFNHESHNNFLLSILRLFGIDDQTFGDTRFSDGPISEFYG